MKCERPLLITNRYTGLPMYVGCRKCDCCRISIANSKALLLRNELLNGWFTLFVTLTYDNAHLPVVVSGVDGIYRLDGKELVQIDSTSFPIASNPIPPKNFPFNDCTGVIYYRDFQLFFKRLRKNLPDYVKFKYVILCEYGSRSKRPHAHIIFFFRERFAIEYFTQVVVKSWQLCNSTVTENGVEYCDPATASYIAGYVNGYVDSNKVFSVKEFRQKVRRSAYCDYGIAKEDKEAIKRAIRDFRNFDPCKRTERPFEYWVTREKDSISLMCVSKRLFDTYFSKPFGFSRVSFNSFRLRCRSIFDFRYKRLSKPIVYNPRPQDLNFIRSYERYLQLFDLPNTLGVFEDYILLFWDITISYNSCVLRRFMLTYKNDADYLDACYQSFIVDRRFGSDLVSADFKKKSELFWLFYALESKHFKINVGTMQDKHSLRGYKLKYKMRLLPKHMNDIYKPLNF